MAAKSFQRRHPLGDELAGERPVAVEGSTRSSAPCPRLELERDLSARGDVGLQGLGGCLEELGQRRLEANGAHGGLTSCSPIALLPGAAGLAAARRRPGPL